LVERWRTFRLHNNKEFIDHLRKCKLFKNGPVSWSWLRVQLDQEMSQDHLFWMTFRGDIPIVLYRIIKYIGKIQSNTNCLKLFIVKILIIKNIKWVVFAIFYLYILWLFWMVQASIQQQWEHVNYWLHSDLCLLTFSHENQPFSYTTKQTYVYLTFQNTILRLTCINF
jgi:hypothetical protein